MDEREDESNGGGAGRVWIEITRTHIFDAEFALCAAHGL